MRIRDFEMFTKHVQIRLKADDELTSVFGRKPVPVPISEYEYRIGCAAKAEAMRQFLGRGYQDILVKQGPDDTLDLFITGDNAPKGKLTLDVAIEDYLPAEPVPSEYIEEDTPLPILVDPEENWTLQDKVADGTLDWADIRKVEQNIEDLRMFDKNDMKSYLPTIAIRTGTCLGPKGVKSLEREGIPNSYFLSDFETSFLRDVEQNLAVMGIPDITAVADETADDKIDPTYAVRLLRDGEPVGHLTFEFDSINPHREEVELYHGTTVADLFAGDGGWARLREMGQARNETFIAAVNELSEEEQRIR